MHQAGDKESDMSGLGHKEKDLGGGHARPGTSRWMQPHGDKETDVQGQGQVGRCAGPWTRRRTRHAGCKEGDALARRQGVECGAT